MPNEFDDDDDVAEEVDEVPSFVKEGTDEDDIEIAGEDISAAQSSDFKDWVDAAKDVVFEITSATINTYTPKGSVNWKSRSLKLYLKVDKAGVDGKGKYAGKVFFPNSSGNVFGLLLPGGVNRKEYDFTVNAKGKPTEWYAEGSGGAFAGYKELLIALGFPVNPTPTNTKEFRASLVGRKLTGDIDKKHRTVLDGGKYVDIKDEFENNVINFRPVKVAAAVAAEEAAA